MREWTDAGADEAATERGLEAPLAALRSRGRGCPDPALWPALEAGVLPEDLASSAAGHLRVCPLCQVLSRDLVSEDVASAAEANPLVLPAAPAFSRKAEDREPAGWGWLWRPLPVAAGLMMALAAVSVWWMTGWREAPLTPAPPTPAGTAPAAVTVLAPRLPLVKPPVTVALGTALAWRSDSRADHERDLADLADALTPYRADDFAAAALRLEALTRRHPTAEVWFYLGVSRLFLAQHDAAAADLRRARELAQPPLRQDASWYLAVALERAGATDAAAAELRPLCREGGERQARACDALAVLQSDRR
jgi:hypothetical protein